jgi:hypothetical protein
MAFVVDEKPHETFRRDGNDLVMTAVRAWPRPRGGALGGAGPRAGKAPGGGRLRRKGPFPAAPLRRPPAPRPAAASPSRPLRQRVSLADALCGAALQVRTLDGRTLDVPVTSVITPGSAKIIRWARAASEPGRRACRQRLSTPGAPFRPPAARRQRGAAAGRTCVGCCGRTDRTGPAAPQPHSRRGEGMPISKTGSKGDLRIKFEITFPRQLSPDQKQQLRGLLAGAA